MKLLIVGYKQAGHMGCYLASAARQLGISYQILDTGSAEANGRIARTFYWRLRDKRPAHLDRFGLTVLDVCRALRPDVVLTTGCAPLLRSTVEAVRSIGIRILNYSTDDPWNPALQSSWFLSALPAYDIIFTPRHANLDDFRGIAVRAVHYLPFAYDPEVHRPCLETNSDNVHHSDVLFVGGCDADRLPLIESLIDEGLELALFGSYWHRHLKTRRHCRGVADQETIRSASAHTKVCLCLVRRGNRDGHVMRSFEAAAIGGCILAEDTPDHRELFGPDGEAVRYFSTASQLLEQIKLLLADEGIRRRLSCRLRERFAHRKDTYAHRLASMLDLNIDDDVPQMRELCNPQIREFDYRRV